MQLPKKTFIVSWLVLFGLVLPSITFATGMVNLGTAANFAILSKTGVSTTGNTMINGDIGASPIAATGITGFGLIADTSNKFSTSALVAGKLYAADYAVPTPATLTTAISDMETAYSEATSRPVPTSTGKAGGEIGGMTFTPGLYKWNTGVAINSDLTLSGGAEDVWIFQVAENLTVASGVKIILADGAQAKNIFWQVAGQTTLNTNSVFSGNILDQTAIVLKTGATLNGRALAETAVTLDGNTINQPGFIAPAPTPAVINPATPAVPATPATGTSTPAIPAVPAIPATPVPPAVPPSNEALQAQLNTLLATLQTLMAQAKSAGITVPAEAGQFVKPSVLFSKNLSLGSKGSDVSALQSFLIAKKSGPEAGKLSLVGATGNFGMLTQRALAEFQKGAGITPASGYFGPKTMSAINSL